MLDATTLPASSASELVARADAAAALFPFDHNLRRLPSALAAGMAASMPMSAIYEELVAEMANDPHARDVAAQLAEVRQHMKAAQ